MKFTEVLLLGSITTPQTFYTYSNVDRCALETAVEATGGDLTKNYGWLHAVTLWPWLNTKIQKPTIHPHTWAPPMIPIYEVIYAMNDVLHWPRPHIAEWVKFYEALYDVPVEQPITEATLATR